MNPQRERHLKERGGKASIAKAIHRMHDQSRIKQMYDELEPSLIDRFPEKNLNERKKGES